MADHKKDDKVGDTVAAGFPSFFISGASQHKDDKHKDDKHKDDKHKDEVGVKFAVGM